MLTLDNEKLEITPEKGRCGSPLTDPSTQYSNNNIRYADISHQYIDETNKLNGNNNTVQYLDDENDIKLSTSDIQYSNNNNQEIESNNYQYTNNGSTIYSNDNNELCDLLRYHGLRSLSNDFFIRFERYK